MKFSFFLFITAITTQFVMSKVISMDENGKITEKITSNNEDGSFDYIKYNNFHYRFYCINDLNDACNKVKKHLNSALDILSNTLEIYQPIVFDAYVTEPYNILTAYNIDINHIPLRTSDDINTPAYLYPQALAKQLNINSKIDYKEKDFTIVFNNNQIDKNEININMIIIHEIIHGLGFSKSNIINHYYNDTDYIESTNINKGEDFSNIKLFPLPVYIADAEKIRQSKTCDEIFYLWENEEFVGYSPFTIFEKNIVDINTKEPIIENIGYLYQEFNSINNGTVAEEKGINEIYENLSAKTKELMSEIPLKYYLKSNSIGLLTNDNQVIPLKTFDNMYITSSSITHTNSNNNYEKDLKKFICNKKSNDQNEGKINYNKLLNEFNNEDYINEDFLMNYSVYISEEFGLSHFGKYNKYGLIGNGIVSILKTLGWTEKGGLKSNTTYYVAKEFQFPELFNFEYSKKEFELKCINSPEFEEFDNNVKCNNNSNNSENKTTENKDPTDYQKNENFTNNSKDEYTKYEYPTENSENSEIELSDDENDNGINDVEEATSYSDSE